MSGPIVRLCYAMAVLGGITAAISVALDLADKARRTLRRTR